MNGSGPILTGQLRFVRRDGQMILQQEWVGRGGAGRYEWKDVPVAEVVQEPAKG